MTADAALGFIDQTLYANDGNSAGVTWRNAEVLELLREIRGTLVAEPTLPGFEPDPSEERTPVERFADLVSRQFDSDLDYDGAEVIRRIEMTAHIITPVHPARAEDCVVCRDDDKIDGFS